MEEKEGVDKKCPHEVDEFKTMQQMFIKFFSLLFQKFIVKIYVCQLFLCKTGLGLDISKATTFWVYSPV